MPKAVFFLLLFSLFFACSDDDSMVTETAEENVIEETTIEDAILQLVNSHRASIGKSALSVNSLAKELAKDHTLYMIDQGAISHDGFGERADQLFAQENASNVGENVAAGYPTAQSVMNAWLNSSGHRQNIEGNFTHIGISAIKNGSGTYYYTQLFLRK